ncbi:hypothetical protein [Desulfamplus magnetovallimortis]|uniref:hypothetical protein n=1 Tax=Desulfamplus magnetovallimortis TaxID=1246637 RepID=UPI0009BB44BC|nr:hypothetical protein [Desulfamplus magnetovallimortis]
MYKTVITIIITAFLTTVIITGCTAIIRPDLPRPHPPVPNGPPPPHPPPPPHADVWVPGHYNHHGVWIPGHWERRPRIN